MDFSLHMSTRTSDDCLEVLANFLNDRMNSYKTDDHMQPQKVPHSVLENNNNNQDLPTFYITNLFLFVQVFFFSSKLSKGILIPPIDLGCFAFYSKKDEDDLSVNLLKIIKHI
ncbi:hypothetical protein PAMP_000111 [Pampus punctatissimus]